MTLYQAEGLFVLISRKGRHRLSKYRSNTLLPTNNVIEIMQNKQTISRPPPPLQM